VNDEFRTGLINRLASLSPQDFQSIINAAKGRRVRTNSKPIPKKLYAKMMTRAKLLVRGKTIKVPFKIEGHIEAKVGISDGHCGTTDTKVQFKSGTFTNDSLAPAQDLEHILYDMFWELDESEPQEMKEYHQSLANLNEVYDELCEMVEEACTSYGHDSYDFLENLWVEAEQELND